MCKSGIKSSLGILPEAVNRLANFKNKSNACVAAAIYLHERRVKRARNGDPRSSRTHLAATATECQQFSTMTHSAGVHHYALSQNIRRCHSPAKFSLYHLMHSSRSRDCNHSPLLSRRRRRHSLPARAHNLDAVIERKCSSSARGGEFAWTEVNCLKRQR